MIENASAGTLATESLARAGMGRSLPNPGRAEVLFIWYQTIYILSRKVLAHPAGTFVF